MFLGAPFETRRRCVVLHKNIYNAVWTKYCRPKFFMARLEAHIQGIEPSRPTTRYVLDEHAKENY